MAVGSSTGCQPGTVDSQALTASSAELRQLAADSRFSEVGQLRAAVSLAQVEQCRVAAGLIPDDGTIDRAVQRVRSAKGDGAVKELQALAASVAAVQALKRGDLAECGQPGLLLGQDRFAGAQGLALLVHPPPEREVLRDADLGLGVVRDGVQAGDLVLGPPPQQGLVALQPHQAVGPVDPGAQERERGDRGRVARAGEVEQGRLCGGAGAVS